MRFSVLIAGVFAAALLTAQTPATTPAPVQQQPKSPAAVAAPQAPPKKHMDMGDLRNRLFGINQMISAGRLPEAQQAVDILRTEAGDDALIDGMDAYIAFHRHEFASSRDILTRITKATDAATWWKVLLAMDMYAMGDDGPARELLVKTQSEDPSGATQAISSMGAGALQNFNREPSAEIMLSLGFLYRTIGARRLELNGLDSALRKFPRDSRLVIARLRLLADASDAKTIVEEATKAAKDAPEDDRILALSGELLARFGEYEKAAENLKKTVKINPGNFGARLDLGAAYQALKKLPEAEAELSALTSMKPLPPPDAMVTALATLGSVYTDLKRWPEALAIMQKGMDMGLESWPLLNNLAWLYATAEDPAVRDPAKAMELASKAVAVTRSRNPQVLDTLAEAYFAAGEKDKAIDTERKALLIAPNRDEFKQHMARYQGLPIPPPTPRAAPPSTPPVTAPPKPATATPKPPATATPKSPASTSPKSPATATPKSPASATPKPNPQP